MICILASNRVEAERFADGQHWDRAEWFYGNEDTLLVVDKFTILRLPSFFELPFAYWSRIEDLARSRQRYR